MIRHYEWVLHAEAVGVFQGLNKRRRLRLLRVFASLAAHPFSEPKVRTHDAAGGEVCLIVVENIALSYHVDHAARIVHIFRLDEEPLHP